jgi:SAM-dependent MidA family methyltransferase
VSELEEIIRTEILDAGPMTFARFMALALYHPTLGYYVGGGTGREPVGWAGDFFTSGDASPLWGWGIAHQLHQMWELLDRPACFDVVEPGAGRGLLAASVWRYAVALDADWAAALRYTLLDRAPAESPLRAARERRLADELARIPAPAAGVRWLDDFAQLMEDQPQGIIGCIISNELVDALPAHVLEKREGALAEVYVSLTPDGARLVETLGAPSSTRVVDYLDRYAIPWRGYPDGWRAEVCPAAEDWILRVARALERGFVLTIDYGASARRLYGADRRRGTLMAYARHQVSERPLAHPGAQDLTAHVNFTALARVGREHGLKVAGLTTQTALLSALGVREQADALAARLFPHAETERHTDRGQAEYLRRVALFNALATLLNPHGLGGFHVLIQRKGIPAADRRLLGLMGESGTGGSLWRS